MVLIGEDGVIRDSGNKRRAKKYTLNIHFLNAKI